MKDGTEWIKTKQMWWGLNEAGNPCESDYE